MTDWLAAHGGVHGDVREGFEPVAQAFIDNFAEFEAHVDEGVRQAAPARVVAA